MSDGVSTLEPLGFFERMSVRRGWRQPAPDGFVLRPEPLSIGSVARGRDMLRGTLKLAGHVAQMTNADLWDVPSTGADFDAARHGFEWLDDLAALASPSARRRAQRWLWEWIESNQKGHGIAWRPALTGRRLLRWVFHAPFLMHATDQSQKDLFLNALSAHLWHLSRRAAGEVNPTDRVEALTAQIVAALCLDNRWAHLATPALAAMGAAVTDALDDHGGLSDRNAEHLLAIAKHICWVDEALGGADLTLPAELVGARDAIALTLRSLRHADASLPRFHGSGAGSEGVLDYVLTRSSVRTRRDGVQAMGYARLSARRSTVIVDASPPPSGADAVTAHASTLAFELTSGRRPIVVNCGPGAEFGNDWRRASRATAGHSALSFEGYSSAQMGLRDSVSGLEPLTIAPTKVPVQLQRNAVADRLVAAHQGYGASHGLTHSRVLELSHDGRTLTGADHLLADTDDAKIRFDRVLAGQNGVGPKFFIRFHLHPDADVSLSQDEGHAIIALQSGEIWHFTHAGAANLTIESSVYLETGAIAPIATKQVVLSGRAIGYATHIQWSLSKTDDTALAVRDVFRNDEDLNL